MPVQLTLITRADCCLCDDMKGVVMTVAEESRARVETVDVDSDVTLRARYGDDVPVLLIDGRKAFKYRVSAAELRRRIARASGKPLWRSVFTRLR